MPDDEHEIMTSAVALVMSTAQLDDSGAETNDRYDWQAAMAAAHGLRLLFDALSNGPLSDAPFCRIICELHEDWVACVGDDAELISAKHRERSFGAYTTVKMLVTLGGLGHHRYHTLPERAFPIDRRRDYYRRQAASIRQCLTTRGPAAPSTTTGRWVQVDPADTRCATGLRAGRPAKTESPCPPLHDFCEWPRVSTIKGNVRRTGWAA